MDAAGKYFKMQGCCYPKQCIVSEKIALFMGFDERK